MNVVGRQENTPLANTAIAEFVHVVPDQPPLVVDMGEEVYFEYKKSDLAIKITSGVRGL